MKTAVPPLPPSRAPSMRDPRYWDEPKRFWIERTPDWEDLEVEAGIVDPRDRPSDRLTRQLHDLDALAGGLPPTGLSAEETRWQASVTEQVAADFERSFWRGDMQDAARLARLAAQQASNPTIEISFCVAAFFCDLARLIAVKN